MEDFSQTDFLKKSLHAQHEQKFLAHTSERPQHFAPTFFRQFLAILVVYKKSPLKKRMKQKGEIVVNSDHSIPLQRPRAAHPLRLDQVLLPLYLHI